MRKAVPFLIGVVLGSCTTTMRSEYPVAPPPRTEMVPTPPKSSVPLIWQPGHYDWDGAGYVWAPGQWIERSGHGTLWQDGYWRREDGTYVWVPPHWM
jgi:WXXGXW repeat (2 copies)